MRRPLLLVCAVLALGGCGNPRTQPADLNVPDAPRGSRIVDLKGLRFTAPANWGELSPGGPRAGGVQSKRAIVAVWRYPRTEALPRTRAQLGKVRDLLEQRVKSRDTTYASAGSKLVRRGHARGIELRGTETINGLKVRVRSLHLFARRTEWVVDAYAPPEFFSTVDTGVFTPLLDSVRVRT